MNSQPPLSTLSFFHSINFNWKKATPLSIKSHPVTRSTTPAAAAPMRAASLQQTGRGALLAPRAIGKSVPLSHTLSTARSSPHASASRVLCPAAQRGDAGLVGVSARPMRVPSLHQQPSTRVACKAAAASAGAGRDRSMPPLGCSAALRRPLLRFPCRRHRCLRMLAQNAPETRPLTPCAQAAAKRRS